MELCHRPQYHFIPLANWMNDPNGLIQWKGIYHLFYQHNPHGPDWGAMHWGHASSPDLVHWTHLPIAMAPTPGGPDKNGVWSGCAIDNAGVPTLVYTGVRPEVQCLAVSDDEMIVWQKLSLNPVIAAPPKGLDVTGFRDPYVWREADDWYMVIGSGLRGVGGMLLLYRSSDLVDWHYLGPLYEGQAEEMGHNWECPNFLALGDRHLLLISPRPFRQAHYLIGNYAAHRFTPDRRGLLDYGGLYYAPQTFIDEAGRRICFGWLLEGRSQEAYLSAGWAGVQSLPRELVLAPDGTLRQRPVLELAALRRDHYQIEPHAFDVVETLSDIRGSSLELLVELDPQGAEGVGLDVRKSSGGEEYTRVIYDPEAGELSMDSQHASLDPESQGRLEKGPLDLDGEPLRLHIFVDQSVIEVFANERLCMTARVYPSRNDSLDVALISQGGSARLLSLQAWTLASIWQSR